MSPPIIERPSPNFDARGGTKVDILVLHYTGMQSAEAALARLTDPQAKVSAHYTVDEAGQIYRHVDEAQRAWHAGVSQWAGASDINARSIGIELVNPGHEFGYRDFPPEQIAALTGLAKQILARHAIAPARVLAHSDIAPARKQDPGERFPWAELAAAGIGLWPRGARRPHRRALKGGMTGSDVRALQKKLAAYGYGYGLAESGVYDEATALVVTAFQRHFRPAAVTGVACGETQGRIERLLALAGMGG
jgi:N-acetylmuramoyl-L-alanine amidase